MSALALLLVLTAALVHATWNFFFKRLTQHGPFGGLSTLLRQSLPFQHCFSMILTLLKTLRLLAGLLLRFPHPFM